MIYCIWYPGGGFGHFINSVLSEFGKDFVRPTRSVQVSSNGNFHNQLLIAPTYLHDQPDYKFVFDPNQNYSVLIDNGIGNEGEKFRDHFANAKVIKICYDDYSWPVIAQTIIVKAMNSSIDQELPLGQNWPCSEDWAIREKYFLYLRDHSYRNMWKRSNDHLLKIQDLFEYNILCSRLASFGIETEDFKDLWNTWFDANCKYINPVLIANQIVDQVEAKVEQDLNITDIWTQSIVYFLIWQRFEFEVPHNDYENFFKSTREIIDLINDKCDDKL